jgi:DNA-binding NarL/FixJ family response regulator
LSNAEIAQRLYLSHATVKTHINRIFAKTGVRDRAQAVRYAYQHGLTTPVD